MLERRHTHLWRWNQSQRLELLLRGVAAQPACERNLRVMVESKIVQTDNHSTGCQEEVWAKA